MKIIVISILLLILNIFWFIGLLITGPLRTIFIYETNDLILSTIILLFVTTHSSPTKIRGGIMYLLAIVCFLFLDHDDNLNAHNPGAKNIENIQINENNFFLNLLGKILNLSDHKQGVVLLLFVTFLRTLVDKLVKKISIQIGGLKKSQFLLQTCQALILIPVMVILTSFQPTGADEKENQDIIHKSLSWFMWLFATSFIALFVFVVNFYTDITCGMKMEKFKFARISTLTCYASAIVLYFLHAYMLTGNRKKETTVHESSTIIESNHLPLDPHPVTLGAIIGIIFLIIAILNLTSNVQKSSKGYFVGYSTFSGLPLYSYTSEHISTITHPFKQLLKSFFAQMSMDKASKPIFYFLLANLAFMLVEIIYGAWTNSLGLISDGFHMLFDCSALVMGLFASLMAKWKPNKTFSYGYGRVEILSGFLNGLFLVLISLNVFMAALDRLFQPPRIESEKLLLVSVIGLIINLIGIFAFHFSGECSHSHSHSHSGHSHSHQSHSHHHDHHDAPGSKLELVQTADNSDINGYKKLEMEEETNGYIIVLPPSVDDTSKDIQTHDGHHSHHNKETCSHDHKGHQHSHHDEEEHHHHKNHSHSGHGHNMNMEGIFLHVLADTLGSVGVIVSSFLMQRYGWFIADPICSLFTSLLIFFSVLPLLKETCYVLLLKTPKELMSDLKGILSKIDRMDHIISYKYPHVWRQSSSAYVVSIRIMINSNSPASYQHYLSSQVSALFADAIKACLGQSVQVSTTVQVEKEIFHKHLSGICSKGYSNTDLMLNHNDPSSPLMIDFYEY
ncbi:proton-coupled zinc antiporter SLC30A5-like isoform X1 [Gordionus sp. m RMFG-2023]|uniref:proton-coupled zinc antiporter SLC30A5-like isoform X1 n=2 Tax=Gordionus sp. m RMFG-2023 TaxID=3053472 RepID=UPI0031FD3D80